MNSQSTRPALLIGSLNLADRDEVFDEVSGRLRDQVRSVPDGETGDRGVWVAWSVRRLEELPGIESVEEVAFTSPVAGEVRTSVMAPAAGVDLATMKLPPFEYVAEAVASYEAFDAARDAGKFHPETRFQVSIPTPMMFAMLFVPSHRLAALAATERALGEELDRLFAAIPAERLGLQWDVCGETVAQEQFRHHPDGPWRQFQEAWPLAEVGESIARVSARIPEEALLGMHLCYGDPDGKHMVEPRDLSVCVDLANSAAESIERRLDWIQMPVPIERDDEAYFAPLRELKLAPETQLYLGLVHKEDGIEGAKRRIERARAVSEDFGVATECGMGREPREAIAGLLDLHREAAAL